MDGTVLGIVVAVAIVVAIARIMRTRRRGGDPASIRLEGGFTQPRVVDDIPSYEIQEEPIAFGVEKLLQRRDIVGGELVTHLKGTSLAGPIVICGALRGGVVQIRRKWTAKQDSRTGVWAKRGDVHLDFLPGEVSQFTTDRAGRIHFQCHGIEHAITPLGGPRWVDPGEIQGIEIGDDLRVQVES